MDRAELLRASLRDAQRLRAAGPRTDDFMRWRDTVGEAIRDMLGADHDITRQLQAAVGPFDSVEAEGLQIHGPDGMLARIDNAEPILRRVLGEPD